MEPWVGLLTSHTLGVLVQSGGEKEVQGHPCSVRAWSALGSVRSCLTNKQGLGDGPVRKGSPCQVRRPEPEAHAVGRVTSARFFSELHTRAAVHTETAGSRHHASLGLGTASLVPLTPLRGHWPLHKGCRRYPLSKALVPSACLQHCIHETMVNLVKHLWLITGAD